MGTKKRLITAITALVLIAALAVPVLSPTPALADGASIWTDKENYASDETVTIFGSGFDASMGITIDIEAPDASVDTIYATTDSLGDFSAQYVLDGMEGTYTVTATDGTNIATTTFTEKIEIKTYDSSCTTLKSDFIQGDTVCAKATGLNKDKYYKIEWFNPSAVSVGATVYGPDGSTTIRTDSYVLSSSAPVGEWKVQVFEGDSDTGPWGKKKDEAKFCVMYAFFSPTDDSWVDEEKPSQTKGSDSTLHVKWTKENKERRTYLKFDLSYLPACTVIDSAILHVYRNKDNGVPSANKTADSWDEGTITWNNQPGPGDLVVAGTETTSGEKQWLTWDITSYAQSEYAGDKTLSTVLKFETGPVDDATTHHADFTSKEGTCDQRPWLEISYHTAQYNLTVESDGCCPITVGTLGSVAAGANETFPDIACCTNVTLTADDSDDYCEFDKWTVDGLSQGTGVNPITVHMGSNHTAIASCQTLGPVQAIIDLTKTATDGAGHKVTDVYVGDTIVYVFEVENPGVPALTSVTLSDDMGICDAGPVRGADKVGNNDDILEHGEVWVYTCSHVVTAGDPDPLDNQATVTGTPTVPGTLATAEATSRVRIIIGEGPTPVGGTVVPVDKAAILAPWIALFVAIALGAIIL